MFNKKRLADLDDLVYTTGEELEKLQLQVKLLEEGELEDLDIMKRIYKRVDLLEKCDNYNTMYEEQTSKRIKELEENLRLVYEYLGVRKEVFPAETLLVEDDCCDECSFDCEDGWEDVCEPENRYTAQEWLAKVKDWGKKFEGLKKK